MLASDKFFINHPNLTSLLDFDDTNRLKLIQNINKKNKIYCFEMRYLKEQDGKTTQEIIPFVEMYNDAGTFGLRLFRLNDKWAAEMPELIKWGVNSFAISRKDFINLISYGKIYKHICK